MFRKVSLWVALGAVVVLQGCATHIYKTEAFSQPNSRFAIVSFGGLTSGLGMDEDADQRLITQLEPVVYQELSKSKHFTLVQPRLVKSSRSYRLIQGEPTDGMYTMKVARGYKKFDPKKQPDVVRKLIADLKLSGIIQVTAYYGKKDSSVFVSGLLPLPVSGGVAHGHITYSVVAYDGNGDVIWQDTIEQDTPNGTLLVMGIANVAKLYPQLVDITQEASHTAVMKLDEKLAANS